MSSIYEKVFAKAYDSFMHKAEMKELAERRKVLLSGLEGNILEIGAGTGINFQYYSKDAHVLAIDPSLDMLKQAEDKLKVKKNIHLVQASVETCYEDNLVERESMDVVVCTLVLCTIPDPQKALGYFYQWLKPGGTLIVIEHIRSSSPWKAKMQDFVMPLWKVLGQGCHINRKTDQMIKSARFEALREDYFTHNLQWYQGLFHKALTSE